MIREIQPTDYKITISRYGMGTRTEIIPTFAQGFGRVVELCKQPDVTGVPFLSRVTQTDLDIQARWAN